MPRYFTWICCLLSVLVPFSVQAKNLPVRDLPDIYKTAELRVLVNQSRNSSGIVQGKAIGVESVRLQAFTEHLMRQTGRPIRLKLIPKAKNQLLPALLKGEGDLVAPGELVSWGKDSAVVRSTPVVPQVPMILVTSSRLKKPIKNLDALSGKTVALPQGSAAGAMLADLNHAFAKRKKPPVKIEWVDASLAIEDVLEMVRVGVYPATFVEKSIAQRWEKVLSGLHLETKVLLAKEDMHWFLRKGASKLQHSVNTFLASYERPAHQDVAFGKAYRSLYRAQRPLTSETLNRLERVRPTLQRYAEKHQFDWLNLAAMAFKESTLNPAARGPSGAVGLMQITPSAARSVGVSGVQSLDKNVQASARYLARIRRDFFSSPTLSERDQLAFTLAAYNLGPQRVAQLRTEAKQQGLNPDQWFFQVERVAIDKFGVKAASYVSTVNKYFLAYARERDTLEGSRP